MKNNDVWESKDLRSVNEKDLWARVANERAKLSKLQLRLKVIKSTGGANEAKEKTHLVSVFKRNIARALTILNEKES